MCIPQQSQILRCASYHGVMKSKYLKKLRGVHHCSFNLNVVECVCVCVGGGGDAGLQHGGGGHHRQLLTQPVRHQVYARCPSYNKRPLQENNSFTHRNASTVQRLSSHMNNYPHTAIHNSSSLVNGLQSRSFSTRISSKKSFNYETKCSQ